MYLVSVVIQHQKYLLKNLNKEATQHRKQHPAVLLSQNQI